MRTFTVDSATGNVNSTLRMLRVQIIVRQVRMGCRLLRWRKQKLYTDIPNLNKIRSHHVLVTQLRQPFIPSDLQKNLILSRSINAAKRRELGVKQSWYGLRSHIPIRILGTGGSLEPWDKNVAKLHLLCSFLRHSIQGLGGMAAPLQLQLMVLFLCLQWQTAINALKWRLIKNKQSLSN